MPGAAPRRGQPRPVGRLGRIDDAGLPHRACVRPRLLRLLDERNVLVLPRLSLRHIGAAKTLSGAVPLTQLLPPKVGELGLLGGVHSLALGSKE